MIEKLEQIALKACADTQVALYDLEIKNTQKGKVILISITKVSGVSVEDCRSVSKKMSEDLDIRDLIAERYFLEVSSPGIERSLRLKRHYASAINETIKITYAKDGQKVTEKGKLLEVLPNHITFEYESGEKTEICFNDIKKAKTFFDFKK